MVQDREESQWWVSYQGATDTQALWEPFQRLHRSYLNNCPKENQGSWGIQPPTSILCWLSLLLGVIDPLDLLSCPTCGVTPVLKPEKAIRERQIGGRGRKLTCVQELFVDLQMTFAVGQGDMGTAYATDAEAKVPHATCDAICPDSHP